MKRLISGMLSLALGAGLCFSPVAAVPVQASPRVLDAAQEIYREDQEMERQLLEESEQEMPEEFVMKTASGTEAEQVLASLSEDSHTDEDVLAQSPDTFENDFTTGNFTADEETEVPDVFGDSTEEEELFGDNSDTEIFSQSGESDSQEGQEGDGDPFTTMTEVTLQADNGMDITGILNSLLSEVHWRATDSNPYKVIIPPGSYQLSGTICLYSNIHLYAVGAVITKTSTTKHILIRLGSSQESAGGYDGYRNVTIEGGTWDSNYEICENKEAPGGFVGFRIGHATHVVIKDVTFLNNLKSHFLEFGGVKDARVTGCTFRGYWEPYESGGQECIQIDSCKDYIFPSYLPYDGTTCEDIYIDGNTFENVFAGVGSHSMMFGRPYRNITITNNTFRNIKKRAVWCLNYQDSLVAGNTMENVGGGVYVRSIYSSNTHTVDGQPVDNTMNQEPENLVIRDNKIKMAKSSNIAKSFWRTFGIQVIGEKVKNSSTGIPDGQYVVKGVTIEGNTISGPGNGIRLSLADNCEVSSNTLKLQKPSRFTNIGIYLGAGSQNTIKNNTVEKAWNSGIYVYNGGASYKISSTNNVLTGNRVESCDADGILIDPQSNNTTLTKNIAVKNDGSGIAVYRSTVSALDENLVQNNKNYGIYAEDSNIKAQKMNEMSGNKGGYAMYMSGCKGKAQSLKSIKVNLLTPAVKKLTGYAAGGKSITVAVKKNKKKIGNGKINTKGQYTVPIKKQKKGTVLVLSVTDKYKNCVTEERKIK